LALVLSVLPGETAAQGHKKAPAAPPAQAQTCPQVVGSPRLDGSTSVSPSTICPPPPTTSVWVDPDGAALGALANTSGLSVSFTVGNNGPQGELFSLSCSATGTVTCTSVSPTSVSLSAGWTRTVTVTYGVGAVGTTGILRLFAIGQGSDDQGSYNVTALSNGPVISLAPHNGVYRAVAKCALDCLDMVAGYSTPPYFSRDIPHSVQLVYRSAQAKPMGMVQVDATDTTTVPPVKMSILLKRSDGTFVTFVNGSTELFYAWGTGANRLAAQFDASSLATGAYVYTVVIRSWRSDGTFRENNVSVRLLILNETNSPFGAGWSIVGLQRLYPQADGGLVITGGDGSIAYFARLTTSCQPFGGGTLCTTSYASPNGDFTSLVRDSITGGTSLYPYRRYYPDGAYAYFDPTLRMALVGDRFGNKTTYGYDASNLLVAITDPTGKAASLGYASNRLRWIKDPGGRTDSITIDASGNLSQIKDWALSTGCLCGQALQFQYDASHRIVHRSDRRGGGWGFTYDFAGKLAADTTPPVTANGQSVRLTGGYASVEQRILINPTTGQGTSSNPAPKVDTAAIRATFTNARGFATQYGLDRFGAAALIQEPLGRTTSFTRDSNSNVLRSVLYSGHTMKYTWNGPDMTQQFDSTTGRTINYTYTASYHQVAVVWGDVDSVVNHWTQPGPECPVPGPCGVLDSTHVGGAGWTKFTSTPDGRLCNTRDPGGHTSDCYFTSSGGFWNTDSIRYTLGTVSYRYDGHGQQVMAIDQVQDTTRAQYDSIGRQVAGIGPLHDTTRFVYDSLYLTKVQDAKGQVYRIWPNALGWADSTKDPAGGVDRYQYDFNGNRTSWTNRNGRTITYTYDSLDQMSSAVADGKTTAFFSDPAGHYGVASNSESVDTLRLDAADRPWLAISCRVLVSGNAPRCFRDSSVYEIRDVRTQAALSAPSIWGNAQFVVAHHYDVHMMLDTLTPGHLNTQTGQPITFMYSAEAMDSVRTLTGLNNLTITHSYPWTHRTDQVQLSDPTLAAKLGTAYNFDNAERLATRYHGSLSQPDTTRSYSYDRAGELIQYADSGHSYAPTSCVWFAGGWWCSGTSDTPWLVRSGSYSYDSVYNRKDPTAPNGGLDPANRLRRWQSFRMDYDAVGNMTAKRTLSSADSTKVVRTDSLFWGALGRLDSVRTRDSSGTLTGRVGFGYDGWGRRVRKSTANGTSRYLWDGDSLLAQLDTLGNAVAVYTYYPEMDNVASVLRRDRGDSTYYHIQDYSRNVLALLARTSTGVTIDNQYRYDPFGNGQGNNVNNVPNPLQFAGREYDAETQLYYDRARYIDPAVGRFVSEDPIGLDGGINLYAFVGNDPVNGWDPSGTKCKDFALNREKVSDKLIHYQLGELLGVKVSEHYNLPRWSATVIGALLGLAHEGPWGKLGSPPRPLHGWIGDHDLWGWKHGAKGAPCAGFFDTFFFMLAPLIYDIWGYDPGFGIVQYRSHPEDPLGGIPFPGILPPTMPPGLRPGWPPWLPTL